MSRVYLGVFLVVIALVILTAVLYTWFAAREATKQQQLEQEHEERMELFRDDEP